jgi:hypothetical protein
MEEELSELYNRRKELAEKIANFFDGAEPDNNDQEYQDLLQLFDSITEQISEIINYK